MKYTRDDYMNKRCTHREYYAQFVTASIKRAVQISIGLNKLLRSTDPHLNDIPLSEWDCIHRRHDAMAMRFTANGDNSINAGTCIVKEAARQLIEEAKRTVTAEA